MCNLEGYPEFISELEEVIIERRTKNKMIASFIMNYIKRVKLELEFTLKRPEIISWKLISGQMIKKNNGSWKLSMLNRQKTRAVYSVDIEFGAFVPRSIAGALVKKNLPEMMKSFKRKIESVDD